MSFSDRAESAVNQLVPALTDRALAHNVLTDVAAGEPIIALVTLLEMVPDQIPADVVDDLEANVAVHDTITGQIARKAIAKYRATVHAP